MTKGQIREDRRVRSRARARRKRSLIMFGGIVFAIIFVTALVVPQNTDLGSGPKGLHTGGHIPLDPDDGRGHIDDNAQSGGPYSVVPATSGPHWFGSTTLVGLPAPARWGRYDIVLPDEILIHNLEHGGVIINHNLTDDVQLTLLTEFIKGQPGYPGCILMHPYEEITGGTIILTAWGWMQKFETLDNDGMQQFIDSHKNRGPEHIGPECGGSQRMEQPSS